MCRGSIHPLIRHAGSGRPIADEVVVDLLELGLGGSVLVVLVRRIRRPAATGRERLRRDESIGIEYAGPGEGAHLAPGRTRAPNLDRDTRRGDVPEREPRLRPRRWE